MSKSMKRNDQIIRVPFSGLVDATCAASQFQSFVSPSLNIRINDLQDRFAEYRFTEIRFRIRTPPTGSTVEHFIGFVINNLALNIGTLSADEVANLNWVSSNYQTFTVKPPWVIVPRAELTNGPLKWYATGDSTPTTVGSLLGWSTGVATDVIKYEFAGVCEFRAIGIPDVLTARVKERASVCKSVPIRVPAKRLTNAPSLEEDDADPEVADPRRFPRRLLTPQEESYFRRQLKTQSED